MNDMKTIPETGTRKKYKDYIFWLATVFAIIVIVLIAAEKVNKEQVELIMIVFTSWATLVGSMFGIYAISENIKKQSYAYLNK